MYWVAMLHKSDVGTGFEVTPIETIWESEKRQEALNKIMAYISDHFLDLQVSVHKTSANELLFIFHSGETIYCITLTQEEEDARTEFIFRGVFGSHGQE